MSHHRPTPTYRSKYQILGLIGRGQFGQVYSAVHRRTGKLVALKALDQRFPTHQFLRELRFLVTLQHPHIVACEACEHFAEGRYLVMDYCEGGTLRSLMEGQTGIMSSQDESSPIGGLLHPALSVQLISDILAGLAHAHSQSVVHCDIKPENILLSVHPLGWTARLSDFGIARLTQEVVTDIAALNGSPAYMAPERFDGTISPAADLYAVGILLYELLVGERPFSGRPGDLMMAHRHQPVVLPEAVPEGLRPILLTALQKRPDRRYPSAAAMRLAIQAAVESNCLLQSAAAGPGHREPLVLSALQGPTVVPPVITPMHQWAISLPIDQLVKGPDQPVYGLAGGQVADYSQVLVPRQSGLGSDPEARPELGPGFSSGFNPALAPIRYALPEPVQELIVRPQGSFAVTNQGLYQLTPQGPILTRALTPADQVAIDPTGQWLAIATWATDTAAWQLETWRLSSSQRLAVVPLKSSPSPWKLLALDHRHVALLSRHGSLRQRSPGSSGTDLQLFTRRGQRLGQLDLNVDLVRLVETERPYQFLATEPDHRRSVLIIDLKPVRMRRIGLNIVPFLMAATPWGYAIADKQGYIVLLNQAGEGLGQLQVAGQPTAMVAVGGQLVVATRVGRQGFLQVLEVG